MAGEPPSLTAVLAWFAAYVLFAAARSAVSAAAPRGSGRGGPAAAAALSAGVLNALFLLEIFLAVGFSYGVTRFVIARAPAVPAAAAWFACACALFLATATARAVLPGGAARVLGRFLRPAARFFYLVLFPVLQAGKLLAAAIAKVTRAGVNVEAVSPAAEAAGSEGGASVPLAAEERDMIEGIFSIRDTTAREVMVPRVDMVTADVRDPLTEIKRLVVERGFSRIPVVDESPDNVVGILHAKDVFKLEKTGAGLRSVLREPVFVPETKKVNELLKEFQARKAQMAVVVDEYGGTAGLITLEDVLEEIVGEIRDEYDAEVKLLEPQGPGVWLVAGRMDLGELNEQLGVAIPEDEYETLGGYISHLAGRVPAPGERLAAGNLEFEVTAADARRVNQVKLTVRAGGGPGKD